MKNKKKIRTKQIKNITPSFTSKKLSAYSGIIGINKKLRSMKLFKKFNRLFPTVMHNSTKYDNSQLFMLLILANLCNVRHLNNVETFSSDPLVMNTLSTKDKVSDSRISERFKEMGEEVARKFEDFSLRSTKEFLAQQSLSTLTLDIDSTVSIVYGNQEGSAVGYNEKKPGAKSYHPLLAFISDYKLVMHTWFRTGNSYTSNGIKDFINQILAHIPSNIQKLFIRADSGFFNNSLLQIIEDKGHEYLVKAKFKGMKDILRIQDWTPLKPGSKVSTCEFDYVFSIKDANGKNVFVPRTLRAIRRTIHKGYDEFGADIISYEYACYCTNIKGKTIEEVDQLYRQRSESENWIEQVKNHLLAGKTLVDDFWANDIFWQLSVFAYNVSVLMRLKTKRWWRQEHKTFMNWFIKVPGIVVSTANRLELRIYSHYIYKDRWMTFFEELEE